MNVIYAKATLYAYPHIEDLKEQIDELSEKQMRGSMTDPSPAFIQCEKLVMLQFEKQTLTELKEMASVALKNLTEEELDLLDYKYFRLKPKEYFKEIDTQSRGYFRKQNRLIEKIALRLERAGVTDDWFDENCMTTQFFKDMVDTVKEYQEMHKGFYS